MVQQRTLKAPVTLTGIGLHSGRLTQITIHPAAEGTGIHFFRSDLAGAPEILAVVENVTDTQLATTLGRGSHAISTVEHVLAALHGMQIDNARIGVDGPEVPILDGSAAPFCEAIARVGVRLQQQLRPYLALRKRVEVKVAEKWAVAEPCSRLEVHASIDWDHPAIGFQEFHYIEGTHSFARDLGNARTFGFLRDVEALKRMGLARGGSLENAVVLDEGRVLNPEGLRYPDEFVRHKILDALGDFKLAGVALHAHFRLHRAGHDLHSQLLEAIFRHHSNYEIIDGNDQRRDAEPRFVVGRKLVANAV